MVGGAAVVMALGVPRQVVALDEQLGAGVVQVVGGDRAAGAHGDGVKP